MLIALLLLSAWIAAAAFLAAWCWWDPCGDAVHFAKTADGWELALHELRPATFTAPRPVILCHGILMCRQCWMPQAGVPSVAEELRRRGHWVWILEMRGSGASRTARADQWNYGFRDYADFDLPAAVEEVKRLTGAAAVDWVGHSLGGMVGYTYLARHGAGSIHAMVTIGSPVRLGSDVNRLPDLPLTGAALRRLRSLDLSRLTRAAGPLMLPASMPWVAQFFNVRGMSRRFALGVFSWCVQRTSTRMIRDLREWQIARGPFLPHVAASPAPYPQPPGGLLAFHGRADRMATPANVETLVEFFPQARIEPADEPGGRPFGHLDLLAGPPEVLPLAARIDAFLRQL